MYHIPVNQLNIRRGSYLIFTPDNMESYLSELVQFKQSQGFKVTVKTLSETGSTAEDIQFAIGAFLQSDPLLEYVLLIGDVDGVATMPSFYYGPENDVTDQQYTHLLGDDYFPDIFIGRFSVDSISELVVMIRKTIHYSRDPISTNPDWLDKALVVAGNYSNTVPIPITPKWTSYWVRDLLFDQGYTSVDTVFYPPTQQGAPFIQNIMNNGVGIVNYRGWGDANGWHYPEFHVSDVAGLNNGWMTPVFTSFVCNANDFANNVDPCLGEALTRAGTPSNPKGGVAIVGPSDLHTNTKFNNIINAYMYDAMFDDGIVELGPAVLAGQMGLVKEFPDLNGPGEAQEFYFHVYNIVGDPSLPILLTTPHEFSFTDAELSAMDGFLTVRVTDEDGEGVLGAVVSVMGNDSLYTSGITDDSGKFQATVSLDGASLFDIYTNKSNYIQGHIQILASNLVDGLVLAGYTMDDPDNDGKLDIGQTINVYPAFKNTGTSSIGSNHGEVEPSLSESSQIMTAGFDIPGLSPGETVTSSTPITVRVNNRKSNLIKLAVVDSVFGRLFRFTIPVNPMSLTIAFSDDFLMGELVIGNQLSIINHSNSQLDQLHLDLQALENPLTISILDSTTYFSIDPFGSTDTTIVEFGFDYGDASFGSSLSYQFTILQDTLPVYSEQREVNVYLTDNHPVSPTWYGYWTYDNTDTAFTEAPDFDWVELDPGYGGSGGVEYRLDDDDHVLINLPFDFQYFGKTYQSLTVSSNGWASFIPCNIDYFYNYTIPMAMGPKALLAPFWDDLEVINNDSIRVYTFHDEVRGRFIIEWSRALNGYDETSEETFSIYLYDQNAMATESGDGVIEFHYLNIANVDVGKNYATVGIEADNKNEGIQYSFNNQYGPGAAELANERAIRFTTEAPENYVAPLGTGDEHFPTGFQLFPAYPNPFNPVTTIRYQLPVFSDVKFTVYDLLGREVAVLLRQEIKSGTHTLRWNGLNQSGRTVASGTYFIVMDSDRFRSIQKVLLIK